MSAQHAHLIYLVSRELPRALSGNGVVSFTNTLEVALLLMCQFHKERNDPQAVRRQPLDRAQVCGSSCAAWLVSTT
jgi:hypothetical protein